ncbi:MAG: YfcC family protein [Kistimonas sp.]|nr:YfcC family protein [Kistimonas sp.]
MKKMKFPSVYTVLMVIIAAVTLLTHIVPAGQYERVMNTLLDRETPVAGSYRPVDPNPQGVTDILMAPVAGFFDPESNEAGAIDVALFVLFIGGFLGIVGKTGAIDAGIGRVTQAMQGREKWMIPLVMALFAAGGTTYGMAEETLAFHLLLIPVFITAGFDALTGVAVVLLGAGIGVLGSVVNPFSTIIASDAAGIAFTEGLWLRVVILVLGFVLCAMHVMRYAERVRKDPQASLVADKRESNLEFFLKTEKKVEQEFTGRHKLILLLFVLTFGLMIWGVSLGGWWMAEMSALLLAASILIGLLDRMPEAVLTETFVSSASDFLGVAFVIALARGIVVVMDAGQITDTVLFWAEQSVTGLSEAAFINVMYWIQVLLSFFIPSSSGLAVLTMPIMAPLADFASVGRELVVTAFQSALGLVNLVTPTSAVIMGGLTIARVPYNTWIKFVLPLLVQLSILIMVLLSLGSWMAS